MDVKMKMYIIFVIVMFAWHVSNCYIHWWKDEWEPFFANVVRSSAIRLALVCIVYFIFM